MLSVAGTSRSEVPAQSKHPYPRNVVGGGIPRSARNDRTRESEYTMATIDHLGIAVKSLAAAKGIYQSLGLTISPEEVVEG